MIYFDAGLLWNCVCNEKSQTKMEHFVCFFKGIVSYFGMFHQDVAISDLTNTIE